MSRLCFTRRGVDPKLGPLGHALALGEWAGIPGRSNRRAVCGASVGRITQTHFNPAHPRACPKCSKLRPEPMPEAAEPAEPRPPAVLDPLPNGDVPTRAGYVIPAGAHVKHQAHQRRRRRQQCRAALSSGASVPFTPEQLREDGWGPRQIKKLTRSA